MVSLVFSKSLLSQVTTCLLSVFLLVVPMSEAKEQVKAETCKNLGKVQEIDDLLFQFYSNIDDQCLFNMPTEELERIWGIRVLDYVNRSSAERNKLNLESRTIRETGQGVFVKKNDYEQGIAAFDINLTQSYRKKNKGWGGSVGAGRFPKLLPKPEIETKQVSDIHRLELEADRILYHNLPKDTVYTWYSKYYWLNKGKLDNQPVLFFKTMTRPSPMDMIFYSEARILEFQ